MLLWERLDGASSGLPTLTYPARIESSSVLMEPSSSSSSSSSIGDEEDMEQTMRGSEQCIEEKKNLASSEETLPDRQCRICYAPEEASGADPLLFLGCTCKGDISYGHQSCLKKWFRKRFQRNGNLDCEVCRSPLGFRLKKIIRSFITAEVIQHAPRLLLLLQIPPSELDHLQVPLETPDFDQLPSETRRSLEASFERLEQEQRRGQRRRREAFETAQSIDADREPSEVLHDDGDYLPRLLLEDMLLNDFLELAEVNNYTEDPPVVRLFTQHPHPSISTFCDNEDHINTLEYPVGRDLRVPILKPEDIVHPSHVEDLLDEVSMQAVHFVDFYGEDLILLPNFMDNLFLEMDAPLGIPLREFHDNDDIPIAIPVLDSSSGGPDPGFAEAARQTDSIPSREFTYGRFQMFQLLQ